MKYRNNQLERYKRQDFFSKNSSKFRLITCIYNPNYILPILNKQRKDSNEEAIEKKNTAYS